MFSGIVEGMGTVQTIERGVPGAACALHIDTGPLAEGVREGDSISVNGACLTVTATPAPGSAILRFEVVDETLRKTNLGELRPGERVNLERALRASARLDGHFVQGHVDAVGEVAERLEQAGETRVTVQVPPAVFEVCVPQGSIAIDGVSLTIAALDEAAGTVTVVLIPTTLERTTLGRSRVGQLVNLEGDILGKYVHAFLQRRK